LVFSNPTPIAFNVNYHHSNIKESDMDGSFNILLRSGMTHNYTLVTTQRMLPDVVTDSIHPWFQGSVRAFEHPYFAVTDESGHFQIEDAPAGSWRLVIWHERIGYQGGAIGRLGERIAIVDQYNGCQKLEPIVFSSDRWDKQ
jgi:hypothetical protein